MDPMIQVSDLTKRYKKADDPAVDDISFDVKPGELFAFLGPNGAGKTTTISILTTTLAKTSGTVTIAGHDLDREARAVRRNIGIIFQNASVDQHLSGEENIRLHVALYGLYAYRPFYRMMPAEYRQRVEELAHVVGLDGEHRQAAEDVLGRHEAQARDHPQPHAPPARAVPRRADVRASTRSAAARSGSTSARSATPTARRSS